MKFEDYAREASRALSASGRSVDVPPVAEMAARRRRSALLLGSTALVVLVAGMISFATAMGGFSGDGNSANGSASELFVPAGTVPIEGGGVLFGPPRSQRAGTVVLPITLLDGTSLTLTLPRSLADDVQGLVPGGAASWELDPCCARSLEVIYGSVNELYGERQPDLQYEDADGNPVGFYTEEDKVDNLVFKYGSWVVRAWDGDAAGQRFSDENREMFASLMRGRETADGFLVLDPVVPMSIGPTDSPDATLTTDTGEGLVGVFKWRDCAAEVPSSEADLVTSAGHLVSFADSSGMTSMCFPDRSLYLWMNRLDLTEAELESIDLTESTGQPDPGTSTTMSTRVDDSSAVEPLRLDDGVSLVPVDMDEGTRIAVLLPTELVPGRVQVDADSSSAVMEADGFRASLTYAFCSGDLQERGSVNARGAVTARVTGSFTVCRPDQMLILDVSSNAHISDEAEEAFDMVPVDLGPGYLAAIEANEPFCCDTFGPLHAGPFVITANRFTSGQVNAWDYETLNPQWTTDIGEYSMLLGLWDELVIATPGRGGLVALHSDNGSLRWETDFLSDEEIVGVSNEEEGVWYVSTEFPITGSTAAPRLYAIDMDTGRVLWVAEGRPETILQWADPAIFPDTVVLMDTPRLTGEPITTTSHLLAFDRATGEPAWSTDLGDSTEAFSDRLLVNDPDRGILIAATPAGTVFSIDPETGGIIWQTDIAFSRITGIGTDVVRLQQGDTEIKLDLQTGNQLGD